MRQIKQCRTKFRQKGFKYQKEENKKYIFSISSWSRESLDTGLDHEESSRELVHTAQN
jgi:hypothetical protein